MSCSVHVCVWVCAYVCVRAWVLSFGSFTFIFQRSPIPVWTEDCVAILKEILAALVKQGGLVKSATVKKVRRQNAHEIFILLISFITTTHSSVEIFPLIHGITDHMDIQKYSSDSSVIGIAWLGSVAVRYGFATH